MCGCVGNGRGMDARQGAIRVFGEIPIPPSSSPAQRRRPAASAPEPASTSTRCAILRSLGPREGRGRSPGTARGDGSRDRASGEAGMVGCGALRRERGFQKKRGWPPAALPSVRRSRGPQGSPVRLTTTDVQDTGSRMANPPSPPPGVACNKTRDEPQKNAPHAELAEVAEFSRAVSSDLTMRSLIDGSRCMTCRPTRHEPAWAVGNGRGTEARQGAHPRFLERGCGSAEGVRSEREQGDRTP